MKRTPLYETHCKLGGKMTEFAGWELPVQYSGILDEHEKVRNAAGLFDVSHMGEILIEGPDAEIFIQRIITNNISTIKAGRVQYSPVCYSHGGVVDDILIYKFTDDKYLAVVNASNTLKDFEWFMDNIEGQVTVRNVSDEYSQLAIQGPKSQVILKKLTDFPLEEMKPFRFEQKVSIAGVDVLVSRTGYTGEDGFELYMAPESVKHVWDSLIMAGEEDGLVPAGLGARDTLRFEAALPLFGHEISENITPVEAGLQRFVKFDKGEFIGRQVLLSQMERGPDRKLVGFEMLEERGIPRNSYMVQSGGKNIGFVTSGTFSPTLKKNLGMALLEREYSEIGTEIEVVIRNRPLKARIVSLPFYNRKKL